MIRNLHLTFLLGTGGGLWIRPLEAFATTPAPVAPVSSSPIGGLFQVFFGLVLVLAAIGFVAWLLRRLAPGHVAAGGAIKLVGGIAVGPKERVLVVEIGETWLVIGVAPGQVNALHEMPRREVPEHTGGVSLPSSFAQWLNRAGRRREESE